MSEHSAFRECLAAEVETLARRTFLQTIPVDALCWSIAERAFYPRNWRLQRKLLLDLATRLERAGSTLWFAQTLPVNEAYQEMLRCSLSKVARLRTEGSLVDGNLRRLVNAALGTAHRSCDPALCERLVESILALRPDELDLLDLFQSAGDRRNSPSESVRSDLLLGERSAALGSEDAVEAGAQHLQRLGLVEVSRELMPDIGQRSLMPRAVTRVGGTLLALLAEAHDQPALAPDVPNASSRLDEAGTACQR
ncbi:MAG: hypothetical protein AB1586_33935 [Pseudomonadota bacterium]